MDGREIDHVALTVRDLPGMERFYETALGLRPMGGDGATRRLGTGSRVLMELRGDPAAMPQDPSQAGLFHTAFLLPSRRDLAEWLRHAADTGLRLTGASDHGVSEAIYLDDPEGNGIEVYRDRAPQDWPRDKGRIRMFTHRLDLNDLAAEAQTAWHGIAADATVGHVHLQVGDLRQADGFFQDELGLDLQFQASGGGWYGWNGYHHHLAGNIWNSRNAGPRPQGMAGLAEVVIADPARAGHQITDPWGTRFRFA